jgi:hypothetical protein
VHDEEQSGQMNRSNRNSQPCSQWLSLVSPLHKIFGKPESEEWPRDKRQCAELAESLYSELFQQTQTEAGPMV